jgi:hypothetical protein
MSPVERGDHLESTCSHRFCSVLAFYLLANILDKVKCFGGIVFAVKEYYLLGVGCCVFFEGDEFVLEHLA